MEKLKKMSVIASKLKARRLKRKAAKRRRKEFTEDVCIRYKIQLEYLKKLVGFDDSIFDIDENSKARLVDMLRGSYPLKQLLDVANLKRSTYYYHVAKRKQPDKYAHIKERIEKIYFKSHKRYGYRRILESLREESVNINHKTVRRLMKEMGLNGKSTIKHYNSYRGTLGEVAPNVLNRQFDVEKRHTVFATDVTEIKVFKQKIYLSVVIDLYNREIVSYKVSLFPGYLLVKDTVDAAIKKVKNPIGLILHSDQGWCYQMPKFQAFLREKGVIQSMSEKGVCLDNAVVESFFGILKKEMIYNNQEEIQSLTLEEFLIKLDVYLMYYNYDRIKLKLLAKSPVDFRLHNNT